jgi:hypothetical protein
MFKTYLENQEHIVMGAKTPYPQHLAYKPQGYSRLLSLAKYPTAVLK